MTLEQLLTTTSGRISRRDYWKALFVVAVMVALSAGAFRIHDGTLCRMDAATGPGKAYFGALGLTVLVVGWMGYAYVAKRLHDVGLSGALALAVVAPYVAVPVVTRVMLCPLASMPLDGLLEKLAALTPVLALAGIALLAAMLQLYLGVQHGVAGSNRYGPAPSHPRGRRDADNDARKGADSGASDASSSWNAQNKLESAPDGQ